MATEQLPLSHGSLRKMQAEGYEPAPVVLKVKSLTPKDDTKFMAVLTDGEQDKDAVLSSQLSVHVKAGRLGVGSIVKVTGCTCNMVPNKGWVLMVSEAEVLSAGSSGGADAVAAVVLSTPGPKAAVKPEASPMHTPSTIKQERSMTAVGPTPPSTAPPSVSQRTSGFSCISALHPYNEQWRLKAKLARKLPMRSIKLKGVDTAVFSVELIDEEGGQIQGTFWRNHAERWNNTLVEGKVYIFERFAVKPANKQFSSVRNDYEIGFTDKTEVSEAADQSAGETMTAAVDLVPIDQLMRYVARKVAVDVIGVVVAVGSGGTVKRKSDNTELARRDVTLADKSGKSVVLTLWGENVDASGALEGLENQAVVQCTACRVSDYNGCSLSTISRSVLTINPGTEQAEELLAWWRAEGASLSLQPVGGDNVRASGGGQASSRQLSTVKEVVTQPVPDLDAKPVYHNLIATVAYINPEQTMYYLANPETGRKVVEQDGRYYSEADGKYCDKASHRYVLSLKVLDATGDVYLSLFNEQAEMVLATPADDLATLKSNSEDAYISCCKEAQWTDWSMSVSTKSREYQGDRKMRHTVVSVKPVCYAQEGQKLLSLIERYA